MDFSYAMEKEEVGSDKLSPHIAVAILVINVPELHIALVMHPTYG